MSFRLENLSVRYGRNTALDGVSLEFDSGALGLLGPNGAGKSSLLRALLGFVPAATGRIEILGLSPTADPVAVRRRIGYAPEEDALFPGTTGVAAVALGAQLSGLPRPDALQRAHDMLSFVGLGEVRYRRVETYSQGMRQRFKLAQAIVHDPDLVILDEPTNGLDPGGRQEMLALVADLVAKDVRVVLSSHLLPDVEAVCDQVAVLDAGRLVAAGRLADLLGASPNAYEVRVKGDATAFRAALVTGGSTCRPIAHGMLLVELPVPGTHAIFAAAAAAACQVRQVLPARTRLEDVFASRVGGGRAHADP